MVNDGKRKQACMAASRRRSLVFMDDVTADRARFDL